MCELVLAGVGGSTIAEAQETITAQELNVWRMYREHRGILDLGLRMELEFGKLRQLVSNYIRPPGTPAIPLESMLQHFSPLPQIEGESSTSEALTDAESEQQNINSIVLAFKAKPVKR